MYKRQPFKGERILLVLMVVLNLLILIRLIVIEKQQLEVIKLTPLPTPKVEYIYSTLTVSTEPIVSFTPRPTKTPIKKPKITIEPTTAFSLYKEGQD